MLAAIRDERGIAVRYGHKLMRYRTQHYVDDIELC